MYMKPYNVDGKEKDEYLGMLKWWHLYLSNIYKIRRFMIDIKVETLHIGFHYLATQSSTEFCTRTKCIGMLQCAAVDCEIRNGLRYEI